MLRLFFNELCAVQSDKCASELDFLGALFSELAFAKATGTLLADAVAKHVFEILEIVFQQEFYVAYLKVRMVLEKKAEFGLVYRILAGNVRIWFLKGFKFLAQLGIAV